MPRSTTLSTTRQEGAAAVGLQLSGTTALDYSASGSPSPVGYTPEQIRAAYGIAGISGDGTGQTIAIVDAFNNPAFVSSTDPDWTTSDLYVFDQYWRNNGYNLPDPPSFLKLDQNGGTNYPANDTTGWAGEIALDVEWAHVIAPQANIVLVRSRQRFARRPDVRGEHRPESPRASPWFP